MVGMIAIGLGCSSRATAAEICALVRGMLAAAPAYAEATLFTLARKVDHAALREAAAQLGMAIVFLDEAEFAARQPEFFARGAAPSAAALEKTGFASVAEATALMGGGPRARLIAPRRASKNVTCALAAPADELTS
ncbi:cobalamin biosynthesis protein [Rhodoblastus sp.]|uniref:cobalamin biosynthesis protein n=1 Tax=Rhodoblastus sp. TaxID=1962975 RepID=UPI0035B2A950